jgi:hypothetical protein
VRASASSLRWASDVGKGFLMRPLLHRTNAYGRSCLVVFLFDSQLFPPPSADKDIVADVLPDKKPWATPFTTSPSAFVVALPQVN